MTRFIKKNGNKQGIILVMVLMILAMAMIFISAALLLTNSTRNRLYRNAEQSQARLTVTSAAEMIYQAISTQEISDTTLRNLAGTAGSAGTTINLTASANVPGLSNSTSGDNNTTMHVYRTDATHINIDFATTIDTETENVRMILKETPPKAPASRFDAPINVGYGDDYSFANINVGAGAPAGTKDNFVIIHGNGSTVDLSRSDKGDGMESTFIFIGETSATSIDVNFNTDKYKGDLVFLGDYSRMKLGSQAHVYCAGNIFFIGKSDTTDTNSFTVTNNAVDFNTTGYNKGWYFVNRVCNASALDEGKIESALSWAISGGTAALVDSSNCDVTISGTSTPSVNLTWDNGNASNLDNLSTIAAAYSDISNTSSTAVMIRKYMDADFSGSNNLPKTADAFASFGYSATHPSDATPMTGKNFVSTYNYATSNSIVPEGTYYLSGGDTVLNDASLDNPKYLFFDGSKEYTIYIGSSYNIKGVLFVVLGPASNPPKTAFILESGVNLTTGYTNKSKGNDSDLFATGFVSVSLRSYTSATVSSCYDAIKYGGSSPLKAWDVLKLSYTDTTGMRYGSSSPYDGVNKPSMYILGAGHNTLTLGDTAGGGAFCEAYVGLYNTVYDKTEAHTSVVRINHNVLYFYGRIEATKITQDTNVNGFAIPYCASLGAAESHDPKPAISDFKIVDMIYYYA
ncbi:MAG: hypothetical protein K6A80_07020 [Saccharofermentans sp.]|nr:hypothetical protein [Saccharofermentans sp.]